MKENAPLPNIDAQQHWALEKPSASGRAGVVCSHHIAASQVGADILSRGGNAMDAAIATSMAISVIEPWMSGIGGGSFLTYYSASDKSVRTVHFGMRSPRNLDVDDFVLKNTGEGGDLFSWPGVEGDINVNGWKSIGVPGHLAGLDHAHKRWATLKWADLLAPSVAMARQGLPVSWPTSLRIATAASELRKDPVAASLFLKDGLPPVGLAGQQMEFLPLVRLSETLQTLADEGVGTFYDGALARSMVSDVQDAGGYLSLEDLSSYKAEECAPLTFERGGKRIHTVDDLTAGPSMKLAFDLMASMSGSKSGSKSGPQAQDVANWARALKSSYETRFETLGDVDDAADPACTTHLSVVDSEGNMVALTQTLLSIFGAKVVLPDSGILMNNGIMWFDPRQGNPNSLGADKRPLCNMAPTIITNADDTPYAALGASGGRRIFPSLLQVISMMIDFDMDIASALHAPRIDVSGTKVSTVDPAFGTDVFDAVNEVLPATVLERSVSPIHYALPSGISLEDGVATGSIEPSAPLGGAVAV